MEVASDDSSTKRGGEGKGGGARGWEMVVVVDLRGGEKVGGLMLLDRPTACIPDTAFHTKGDTVHYLQGDKSSTVQSVAAKVFVVK
jgi:hypothetical protein